MYWWTVAQCCYLIVHNVELECIGCSTPQIDSKGLSRRALRCLVKFTGQGNPPKSSSKKSGDSELDWGCCLQGVLHKGSHCTVPTATRAKINERKRKGPGFKSQRVQSFLSEEKNTKNRENITVASGEKDSPLGKRWTGKTKGLDLCRALEPQINSSSTLPPDRSSPQPEHSNHLQDLRLSQRLR